MHPSFGEHCPSVEKSPSIVRSAALGTPLLPFGYTHTQGSWLQPVKATPAPKRTVKHSLFIYPVAHKQMAQPATARTPGIRLYARGMDSYGGTQHGAPERARTLTPGNTQHKPQKHVRDNR